MASRKTYPCFQCEKAGHKEVQVFLDGKDESGRTKYLNEDGTRHTHLGSSQQSQQQAQQQQQQIQQHIEVPQQIDVKSLQSVLKANFDMINAKIERIIALLEKEQ